ncbi:MAG: TonB family protein [Cyanobacteria bacterium J06643_4]
MGFSKEIFEQYRREVRIMWRVLAVGAVIAGSAHFLSLPFISRLISVATGDSDSGIDATPIEIVVEEEVTQVAKEPEPEPEPPEEQPEPAASADRPSAAPLATNNEPVPLSDVAAANTVAVSPSIATENGEVGGEGAVGESSAIGIVPGSGEPIVGDRINLPGTSVPPEPRPRQRVEETSLAARRQPDARVVSCNPCSVPDYPGNARRNRSEGQPVINVVFDENGRVVSAEIEVTSGNEAFDQAALEEARRNWRFQDSQGTGGQVSVDVTYVVRDSDQYEEARQAGEVLAVELPTQQQIRPVTSGQSPAQSTSPPTPVATPAENAPSSAADGAAGNGDAGSAASSDSPTVETSSEGNAPTENAPTEADEPSPEAPISPEPVTPSPAPPAPVSPEPVPVLPRPDPIPLPAVPEPQPAPQPAAPPVSEPAPSAESSPETAQ